MVKHHKKPARRDIRNEACLTPLTLASKLGRHKLFKEVLETNCIVSKTCLQCYVLTESYMGLDVGLVCQTRGTAVGRRGTKYSKSSRVAQTSLTSHP